MIFIILCGGSGTRLWPISRSNNPKQLHSFVSDKTLLQDTILRVQSLQSLNNEPSFFYFVTGASILDAVKQNIEELNLPTSSYHIIVEPFGQNSCPPIFFTTHFIKENMSPEHLDEFIVVMSSDHKWDDEAFCQLIQKNNLEQFEKNIITIGIQPTSPHTGYGYIQKNVNSNNIIQFKEKPDIKTATEYVQSGNFLWNSGTFIFKSSTLLHAFEIHQESMFGPLNLNYFELVTKDNISYLSKDFFHLFPNVAFDYAIMEKIDNGVVIPFHSTWSDIGSFDTIYDISSKDENENVCKGNIVSHDTRNSYIHNITNETVATVGIDNLVIVKTEGAILIMNKDKCQDIKKIIEKIDIHLK